ncbi:MAG TPA: GNAT family N-acetyltransferase [Flavobacteriales bacterium]|nr:GNAT family N-acetyltransferase [Flavobacteriales bacterium]
MNSFDIRLATVADVGALTSISRETFAEAYGDRNKREDIDYFNNRGFNRENIAGEINNTELIIYVNGSHKELYGYVVLKASTNYGLENALEIKRIYVRKICYGNGLGNALMQAAIRHAGRNGFSVLALAVWKENHRAILFYKKQGFAVHTETTFDWGTGKVDDDWVMVKEVQSTQYKA